MASLLGDVKNEGFVVSTSEQFATRTCPQEMYCKGFEILVISCLKYPVVLHELHFQFLTIGWVFKFKFL